MRSDPSRIPEKSLGIFSLISEYIMPPKRKEAVRKTYRRFRNPFALTDVFKFPPLELTVNIIHR
jgi:hypothetical protein